MSKEKVVIQKARLCFNNLFRAKKNDRGQDEFKCTLILEEGHDLSDLKEAVKKCAIEKFGRFDNTIKHPFKSKKTMAPDKYAGRIEKYPVFKDKVWLEPKTQYAPIILGLDKKPLMDQTELYAGCYVHVSVSPYPWSHPTNGHGVGLNVNAVMKAADGERLGALPGQEFEDILSEVGFEEDDMFSMGADTTTNFTADDISF